MAIYCITRSWKWFWEMKYCRIRTTIVIAIVHLKPLKNHYGGCQTSKYCMRKISLQIQLRHVSNKKSCWNSSVLSCILPKIWRSRLVMRCRKNKKMETGLKLIQMLLNQVVHNNAFRKFESANEVSVTFDFCLLHYDVEKIYLLIYEYII